MNWTNALVYERLIARQTAAARARLVEQARRADEAKVRPSTSPGARTRTVRGIWFPGRPITIGS